MQGDGKESTIAYFIRGPHLIPGNLNLNLNLKNSKPYPL